MAQMLAGLKTSATAPRLLSGVFLWERCGSLVTSLPSLLEAPGAHQSDGAFDTLAGYTS